MAKDIRVHSASAIVHRQTCMLHDNERTTMCSGTLRKGGNCVNKATSPRVPGMMPTCKIHQDQLKMSGWCRAPLPCGFECGRLFEWKPHGFQLCPGHSEYPMTCYFLKIPMELRLRVYRFLLPDRPIPAGFKYSSDLTTDDDGVYTAILRVNHQIHDEAAYLLYSTRVFTIELFRNRLSMCNSANKFDPYWALAHGNRLVQYYQMRLMLLEQSNKRRLLRARQEQDNINGESNPTSTTPIRVIGAIQLPTRSSTPYTYGEIEPVWHPPLGERYFNMIRSFRIVIVFPPSEGPNSAIYRAHGPLNTDTANHKVLECRLYNYCDCLHRLVGRLRLIQAPIAHLEISIRFGNTYITRDKVFFTAQLLLQPFRHLRNVAIPVILSITVKNFQGRETKLPIQDWSSSAAGRTFVDYLKCWSRDISSSQLSFKCPQVFETFWQLEKLISSIIEHSHYAAPEFYQLEDLLHAARIAREAEDLTCFREIWDRVVNIWFDYLNSQKDFQSNVERSINSIYDMVGKGPLDKCVGEPPK
jgi:hypothetical protein